MGSGTYFRALDEGEGGYILTNNHVVDEGETYQIEWLDGTIMDATLVGADEGTDIAVLQFNEPAPEGATPVPLGDSDALQIGELAIVIGNPGSGTEVLFGTVTAGIISGLEREGVSAQGSFNRPRFHHSGGRGHQHRQLWRRASERAGRTGGHSDLEDDRQLHHHLRGPGLLHPDQHRQGHYRSADRERRGRAAEAGRHRRGAGWPGRADAQLSPAGVRIENVEEGSPADEAGLQAYDIITEINGVRVYTNNELIAQIDQYAAGDTVN